MTSTDDAAGDQEKEIESPAAQIFSQGREMVGMMTERYLFLVVCLHHHRLLIYSLIEFFFSRNKTVLGIYSTTQLNSTVELYCILVSQSLQLEYLSFHAVLMDRFFLVLDGTEKTSFQVSQLSKTLKMITTMSPYIICQDLDPLLKNSSRCHLPLLSSSHPYHLFERLACRLHSIKDDEIRVQGIPTYH